MSFYIETVECFSLAKSTHLNWVQAFYLLETRLKEKSPWENQDKKMASAQAWLYNNKARVWWDVCLDDSFKVCTYTAALRAQ